jgi:hypothetical protein
MKSMVVGAVIASMFCVACSSQMQRSSPLSPEYLAADPLKKFGVTGMPYFLPDTVVPVTIAGDFVLLPDRKEKDKKLLTGADYEYVLTLTLGVAKQVADPDAALMFEYQPEAGTSDTFKLAVGANGLLSNVSSTSKDESAAIIIKLAELAKEGLRVATAFARPAADVRAAAAEPEETAEDKRRRMCAQTLQKMSVTTEVNLSDLVRAGSGWQLDQQTADFNAKVVRAMQIIDSKAPQLLRPMEFTSKARGPLPGTVSNNPIFVNPKATAYSGIVFRIMTPRALSVELATSGANFGNGCSLARDAATIGDMTFMVADPLRTFVVDNSRTAFVTKKVNLTVSDGVLLGIDVEKPSELLAAITLPVEVLKVIASIPGEMLSIKVKQISDEKSLSAAQVEMLKLQIDLIKQRQALIDAQSGAK